MTLDSIQRKPHETDRLWAERIREQMGVSLPTAVRYVQQDSAHTRILDRINDAKDIDDLRNVVREMADLLFRPKHVLPGRN